MGFDLSVYSLFVTVLGCVVNRKFQKVTDKTPLRILYVQNQEKNGPLLLSAENKCSEVVFAIESFMMCVLVIKLFLK